MQSAPRYAVYFVPSRQSALYRYGSSVLGYDCYSGNMVDFPPGFAAAAPDWRKLTAEPRRYGFHATLKAPFALLPPYTEEELIDAVHKFAGRGPARCTFIPAIRALGSFCAIIADQRQPSIDALAASCTTEFDVYRAPMSAQERARRTASGLSQSQTRNLDRWGYPYVLSDFRFHMTLTGKIASERREAVLALLQARFDQVGLGRSIAIDRLVVVRQDSPSSAFRVISHSRLIAENG